MKSPKQQEGFPSRRDVCVLREPKVVGPKSVVVLDGEGVAREKRRHVSDRIVRRVGQYVSVILKYWVFAVEEDDAIVWRISSKVRDEDPAEHLDEQNSNQRRRDRQKPRRHPGEQGRLRRRSLGPDGNHCRTSARRGLENATRRLRAPAPTRNRRGRRNGRAFGKAPSRFQ